MIDMGIEYKNRGAALQMKLGREKREIEISIDKQRISVAWSEKPEDYKAVVKCSF
jgi:hypothetical protein